MNNNTNIHQLIERYFAGETTLKEEEQLKVYFQADDTIAPDLKQYQHLFNFFTIEQQQQTSAQFAQKLQQQPKRIRLAYRWAVAATIAILLAVGGYWLSQQSVSPPQTASAIDWSQYEPQTEAEALRITQKALSRTTHVIQQSMATAKGEIDNIQNVLQTFK